MSVKSFTTLCRCHSYTQFSYSWCSNKISRSVFSFTNSVATAAYLTSKCGTRVKVFEEYKRSSLLWKSYFDPCGWFRPEVRSLLWWVKQQLLFLTFIITYPVWDVRFNWIWITVCLFKTVSYAWRVRERKRKIGYQLNSWELIRD